DRRRERAARAPGGVDRLQLLRGRERVREAVGEDVDRFAAGVELDRVPFVVDDGGHAAHDRVALRPERDVGVQPVDHGRDLQGQHAAAAAEDPLALDAVAVVDAVADALDVTAQAVGGGDAIAVERGPDPVHAVVREGLRFCEFARGDRPGMLGAAATCERAERNEREDDQHGGACVGGSVRGHVGHYLGVPFGVPSHRTARTPASASGLRPVHGEPSVAELATPAVVLAPPREHAGWRATAAVAAPALALAVVLLAAWLIVDPHTPDLAAQVYRAGLFRQLGFAVWDGNWYAGHHLPGYSLLFPALATWIGLRTVGVLCVLASTTLFAALVADGDVWLGRLAFALGVAIAFGAALALQRGHAVPAAVLAALAAAASPV